MDEKRLQTNILPKDFREAARRHGRHFARYLFAAHHAAGARVLDAACGSGYGAAYLAEKAKAVLALDISAELIEWARRHHARPNLRYGVHDLHEAIAGEEAFDLVTSFETLEHVAQPEVCVANLARALDDGGTALISVPNGTKELRDQADKPYHQRHFSAEAFTQLLRGSFGEVEFFSQVYSKGLRHYLRKLMGQRGHRPEGYRFVPDLNAQAKTWLAVCRKPRRPA